MTPGQGGGSLIETKYKMFLYKMKCGRPKIHIVGFQSVAPE